MIILSNMVEKSDTVGKTRQLHSCILICI